MATDVQLAIPVNGHVRGGILVAEGGGGFEWNKRGIKIEVI